MDSIKMRKIRYDVLQYLEELEVISKIEDFLDSEDKDISNGQDLLNKVKREISFDLEEICNILKAYVDSYCDIDSINHSTLLDYIYSDINVKLEENNKYLTQETPLYNFLFQLVQIQKIQSKMIDTIYTTMYRDKNNDIYSAIDNKLVISYNEIVGNGNRDLSDEQYNILVENFIGTMIIETKRKIILGFEFDNEGFYLSASGDEYFNDEEKKEIIEEAELRLKDILNEDGLVIEQREYEEMQSFINDESQIVDDISLSKKEGSFNESKERFSNLKNILKESSNKIKKE